MAREATLAAPVVRPLLSRRARELLTGYCYLIPVILALGCTVLFPILKAMQMSLYNHVLIKPQEYGYVGLANYARLLHDEVFWLSLWNSFVWVFGSVTFQFLGGFAAALLLHQPFRARAVVRTLTLLPWISPGVVVALIWEFIYQPNYGLLNDILSRAGLMTERIAWLANPSLAMPAVILANIWRGVPFFAIMLLAGLQAIPGELYEAARMDGASVLQRFRFVTLPMLKPIIVVATATRVVWTFNYADLIFVMTSGGPANATQITSTYTLLQAYSNLDFGYAATLSVTLLLIMLAFTVLYLRLTRGLESVA
jgi:multiple sugar transport system permease protein